MLPGDGRTSNRKVTAIVASSSQPGYAYKLMPFTGSVHVAIWALTGTLGGSASMVIPPVLVDGAID